MGLPQKMNTPDEDELTIKNQKHIQGNPLQKSADKRRLAPQDPDKQNNLKEAKKKNVFKMLIETKERKKNHNEKTSLK